jgi:hypothetical protein
VHFDPSQSDKIAGQVRSFGVLIELAWLEANRVVRDDLREGMPNWWPYIEAGKALACPFVVIGGKPWLAGAAAAFARDTDHAMLAVQAVHTRLDEFGGLTYWTIVASDGVRERAMSLLARITPAEGNA